MRHPDYSRTACLLAVPNLPPKGGRRDETPEEMLPCRNSLVLALKTRPLSPAWPTCRGGDGYQRRTAARCWSSRPTSATSSRSTIRLSRSRSRARRCECSGISAATSNRWRSRRPMADRPSIVDAAQAYLSAGLCVLSAIRAEKRTGCGPVEAVSEETAHPGRIVRLDGEQPRRGLHSLRQSVEPRGDYRLRRRRRAVLGLVGSHPSRAARAAGHRAHAVGRLARDLPLHLRDLRQPQAGAAQGGREDRHPHRDSWRGRPVPCPQRRAMPSPKAISAICPS